VNLKFHFIGKFVVFAFMPCQCGKYTEAVAKIRLNGSVTPTVRVRTNILVHSFVQLDVAQHFM